MRRHRPSPDDIVLGHTLSTPHQLVVLSPEHQRHHIAALGKSGAGKSSAIVAYCLQCLSQRKAFCLIDPHDAALSLVAKATEQGFFREPEAFSRLVYVDFGNGSVVPYNLLAGSAPKTVALQTLQAATRVWPSLAAAPTFQTLFLSCVATLAYAKLPLIYLQRLTVDRDFRQACLAAVPDPLIHETFTSYETASGRLQDAGTLQRRAFLLTFSDLTRRCFGQPDSIVQIRSWMDSGTSVIFNLGTIDDAETRHLIGALLMVQIEQATLSRSDTPKEQRRVWRVIVDEFPSFLSSDRSIAVMLEQARKYSVPMLLAAQSTSQIGSDVLEGALENCRTHIAMGLARKSAAEQAKDLATVQRPKHQGLFESLFSPAPPPVPVKEQVETLYEDLQVLDPAQAYVKLDNQSPVKVQMLRVDDPNPDPAELAWVLDEYKARYQRSQQEADTAIAQLAATMGGPGGIDEPDEPFRLFGT